MVMAAASAARLGVAAVSQHTIAVVSTEHLLPRWDLATHLSHGWLDYHLLITGQIHRLFADLWRQGYWPPGLSLFQIPFFVLLGGDPFAGLWSSAAAFVLLAAAGALILTRDERPGRAPGAAVFVLLLTSSPYLLAYATVTMTEMLGAVVQLAAVLAYAAYVGQPEPRRAKWLALSFTALFFVKYNYFVLLAIPFVIHLWLERTWDASWQARSTLLADIVRRSLRSPAGVILVLYVLVLTIVLMTGGFSVNVAGQRISIRSIGSSGHILLYGSVAWLAYRHWTGRIDWKRIFALEPLIQPFLIWFALPITVWLASPHPNHIRDLVNLVLNRPMGEASLEAGIDAYLDALRQAYFYSDLVLLLALASFVALVLRYRTQAPWMRLLLLAIPIQFAAIAVHQTRFPRFLLLTVVLLCLAAASQIGRWIAALVRGHASIVVASILFVIAAAVPAAIVRQDRFETVAFEHYTRSESLHAALRTIRSQLTDRDRLVIVGQSNQLSPALFRLAIGPPSGGHCFPFEIGGADRLDISAATHILLLTSVSEGGDDPIVHNPSRLPGVLAAIERQEFTLRQRFAIPEARSDLALYARPTPPPAVPSCS